MVCKASALGGRQPGWSKRHFLHMLNIPPAVSPSTPSRCAVASPGLTPIRLGDWSARMQEMRAAVSAGIDTNENRALVLLQHNPDPVSEVLSC